MAESVKKLQLEVNTTAPPEVHEGTYTIHPTTAPPTVHDYFGEGAYMFLTTDSGSSYVSMSYEHLQKMHEDVLNVGIERARQSGSLDRWHTQMNEAIAELVRRCRDFHAAASPDNWEKPDRWSTDLALAHEPDFQRALKILNSDVGVYWDLEEDSSLLKEPEEIEDFLQFLIDSKYEYEDLTPGQQNLLQTVRRVHNKFWRNFNKIIKEYDEEKAQLDKEKAL